MIAPFVIILVLCFGVARYAMQRCDAAIAQGRKFSIPGGHTAGEIVREFLDANGASDVKLIEHTAMVSDYFDAGRRCLFLNKSVMDGTDAGALATAMHEAGHAMQGGSAAALNWRMGSIKLTRYVPALAAAALLVLSFLKRMPVSSSLRLLAVVCFFIMLMNVLSLPIEFNASQRAQAFLEERMARHSRFVETMSSLLRGVAMRDTGGFLRSPMYCLFGLMPAGGKLRPQ